MITVSNDATEGFSGKMHGSLCYIGERTMEIDKFETLSGKVQSSSAYEAQLLTEVDVLALSLPLLRINQDTCFVRMCHVEMGNTHNLIHNQLLFTETHGYVDSC